MIGRNNHYLGVDVGTGSARVCIIDETGEILGLETKNIITWNEKVDYYEQSTEDIWNAICFCCKKVLKQANVRAEDVKGIGFDATCSLAVLAEDTDEPISVVGPKFEDHKRNIILWMDHRPVTQAEKIKATKHNLLRFVGGNMSIEMEIPKVLWLKENMPAELFNRCKFYDLADVLTHIATGKETRSYCSTVCKQGYVPVGVDGSVKGWQEDFLRDIGLAELAENNFRNIGGVHGKNGEILSAGEPVGILSEEAAHAMGLVPGIKIGSGIIDAYAGWIGTVGAKINVTERLRGDFLHESQQNELEQAFSRLAVVAGTSTCHLVMSKEPIFVSGVWGPYRDILIENLWMAEGGQSATGSLLNHIVTTHPAYQHAQAQAEADQSSQGIYGFLNSHLEYLREKSQAPSISYIARHFFFVGDYHGNRSPIADPNMRGAVVGLSMDASVDGLAKFYYAALEFIAQQTRHIIDTLNSNGHNIRAIFMSGGQCRNTLLMSLIANCTGYPVIVPKYIDAAVVLGAAMLGAKAASGFLNNVTGKYETEGLWSIMNRMSKPGSTILPTEDKKEKKLLEAKYKIFLRMSKEQQEYRNLVDQAVAESN